MYERKIYKSCLLKNAQNPSKPISFSRQNPIQIRLSGDTAVYTVCKVAGFDHNIEHSEFPLELKSDTIYTSQHSPQRSDSLFPTDDTELDMNVVRLSRNLYTVRLSWSCPSSWNGMPNFYQVDCRRISPVEGTKKGSTSKNFAFIKIA